MKTFLYAVSFAAAVALPGIACAQSTNASPTSSAVAPQSDTAASKNQSGIQAKVRQDLQNAGFTDINVVPEGFLVQAKNKEGTPVMMIINPNSVAEFVGGSSQTGRSSASARSRPAQISLPRIR